MSIEDLACHGEQIEKLVAELTALRAWKLKARPFLEKLEERIFDKIEMDDGFINREQFKILEEDHEQLTELLGGSDEQNT